MAEQAPELFTTEDPEMASAMEGAHDGAHTEHADPVALGMNPGGWVGLAMLVLLLILIWKGVLKAVTGGLDGRIAAIREQLDEAKKLRSEAEALRAEYETKIANAEKDAAAMLDHARTEATAIVEKARTDTEAMVARRERMAEDKIAAAERGAVDELRARAARAATAAAGQMIAARHDETADRKLVDEVISGI